MNELKVFFNRPAVKAVVNGVLSLVVATLASVFFSQNEKSWLLGIITATVFVGYIFCLIFYALADTNLKKENDGLKEDINSWIDSAKVYNNAIQGLSALCQISANRTNMQIHEIVDNARIDCNTWNFDMASSLVCKEIYTRIIKDLCVKSTSTGIIDIEVCYVKMTESGTRGKTHRHVNLCAYYNPSERPPKLLKTNRDLASKKQYYDAKLFIENNSEIIILKNSEEIKKKFLLSPDKEYDYEQYIGIPIVCESSEGGKMVGLLEIVCHNGCIISNDKKIIRDYVDRFFTPYAQLLLLLFKMEKALKAMPANKEAKNGLFREEK